MIRTYFDQIKATVDQYTATRFVLDANVKFETRPGDQGYLAGSITFTDDSVLHFSEFLDAVQDKIDKLMYTYHYQDAGNRLVFRYDNARHRPPLSFLEHKHTPTQVTGASAPTVEDVLDEIAVANGWV